MSNANRFWYVLQTSFHRELQIQLQLNRMRIRSFIPMHYEETTESGRRRIRRKPAVHNLIFVRISPAWLQKIKTAKLIPAKCMYDKTTQMPLIVPDKQMDDFIALTEGKFEDVLLIDPSTEKLERATWSGSLPVCSPGSRANTSATGPRTGSSSGSKASRPSRRPKCPRPTSRKYLLKHIRSGRPFRPRGWFYLQLSVKTRHII